MCQINAAQGLFHTRAHVPEHGVNECDNNQEAQNESPHEVKQIRDAHENCARDATAHSRSPRPINLVTSCSRCQKAHEENHEAESSHASGNYNKYHLHSLDPKIISYQLVML